MQLVKAGAYFFIITVLLCSCQTIKVIKQMHARSASYEQWTNGEKQVVFIPMVHVSTPEFYADVKRLVTSFKQDGYIVYYEGVKKDDSVTDSARQALYLRKMQRMLGLRKDSLSYAAIFHQKGVFKKLVGQPKGAALGLDTSDRAVDLTLKDIVDAYEHQFGEIEVNPGDLQTSAAKNTTLTIADPLPRENVKKVILDLRNAYLSNQIVSSTDKRILVLYGKGHVTGTFGELVRKDRKWAVQQ